MDFFDELGHEDLAGVTGREVKLTFPGGAGQLTVISSGKGVNCFYAGQVSQELAAELVGQYKDRMATGAGIPHLGIPAVPEPAAPAAEGEPQP